MTNVEEFKIKKCYREEDEEGKESSVILVLDKNNAAVNDLVNMTYANIYSFESSISKN